MQLSSERYKEILYFNRKEVGNLMLKMKLTEKEAVELVAFDLDIDNQVDEVEEAQRKEKKEQAKRNKEKRGVQPKDLELLEEVISKHLNGKEFKNKELHILVSDTFSIRQTPSRLKKMVASGFLEDLGGTPKTYKMKEVQ